MIPASYLYKDLFHQAWYEPVDVTETPAPSPKRGIRIPDLGHLVRSLLERFGHHAGIPRPV